MALVELRNVSKIYHLGGEEIRALDDLSLDIQEGEFISIIGPSGSGKSTLMHILGCLDSPTSGTLKLDGTLIHDASPRDLARIRHRKIALVTHDPEIAAVTPRRIEIRDGKISKQLDPKLAGLDRVNAEQGARNAEPGAGTQRPAAN